MFAPFIRLAASKARSTVERGMLAQVLALAVRLDEIEASFESNINGSKAARGESPTKLPKAKRAELHHFEEDANELEGQQLVAFGAMTYSADVIAALHTGMESDVKFWKQAQRHTHPADAPVVKELVEAKIRLFESMALFLVSYPPNDA
jgi:hypothetical protein